MNMNYRAVIGLLKAGNYAEAKKAIVEHIDGAKMTQDERGQVYIELATAYMNAGNYLLGEYNAFLNGIVSELDQIEKNRLKSS